MIRTNYKLFFKKSVDNQLEIPYKKPDHIEDSGVDIIIPNKILVPAKSQVKLKLGVHCMVRKDNEIKFPTGENYRNIKNVGFFLLPRSSISKTPLRLSNSIGLIDSGYRGELMACVDNISEEDFVVEEGVRLFQIINSDLEPFEKIELVEEMDETTRGSGGFGSTGK